MLLGNGDVKVAIGEFYSKAPPSPEPSRIAGVRSPSAVLSLAAGFPHSQSPKIFGVGREAAAAFGRYAAGMVEFWHRMEGESGLSRRAHSRGLFWS
ncbi:hypothetical protein MJK72_06825 [Klebsiella pneumoniae]|nr:hypothetical protein MJK72_06825 [Klebsiella pneumoniae]